MAYRVLPNISSDAYEGGLIVNSGSGWHIDRGAQEAMGTRVPWAVAGLADGGAAFSASQAVFERQGPGAAWHPTATQFPGGLQPGSLTAFRESGAMRVVAAGGVRSPTRSKTNPKRPPASRPR